MVTVAGKVISDEVLAKLRAAVAQVPAPSRRQLSLWLCQWLDWKNAQGQYQPMMARTALLTLQRQGVLTLPVVKPLFAQGPPTLVAFTPPVLNCRLGELGAVELVPVTGAQRALSQLWNTLIHRFHPLGYRPMAGAQRRYLIRCPHGWIGALGFGASAKSLQARDQFIGWSRAERQRHGSRIVCNWRFLILPTVQVKHLASHVLGRCARQLPQDWQARYGYPTAAGHDLRHWLAVHHRNGTGQTNVPAWQGAYGVANARHQNRIDSSCWKRRRHQERNLIHATNAGCLSATGTGGQAHSG